MLGTIKLVFSFGHCVICSFSIYLQTLLNPVTIHWSVCTTTEKWAITTIHWSVCTTTEKWAVRTIHWSVCTTPEKWAVTTIHWSVSTTPEKWAAMYLCWCIDFTSSYEFDIWFRNCSDCVVYSFLLFILFK